MHAEPTITDLIRVIELLGLDLDPGLVMKDHPDARRRAELMARIAAGVADRLGPAEALAGLDVDDRADLHWDADREVASGYRAWAAAPDGTRLLDLQLARLAWVHHVIVRGRTERSRSRSLAEASTVPGAVGERGRSRSLAEASTVRRGAGPRPDQVGDVVATTLGALIQLVEQWRDSRYGLPGGPAESRPVPADPMLADALLMVRDAADHLAGVLRTRPASRTRANPV